MAEPDEGARRALCAALSEAGYEALALTSGEEVLDAARHECPRLVILEVCLPGICGYDVCRRLREKYADALPIVFVSGTRTESYDRVAGLLLGADDYLCKPLAADELLARVGRLLRPAAFEVDSKLTPREQDVLQLLKDGLTHKQIADELCISDKTVGTHIEHVFRKLGVHNAMQAVALAGRHGLARSAHEATPTTTVGAR